VQVAADVAALEQRVPAEFQLLLERGAGLVDELLGGDPRADLQRQQGEPVRRPLRQRGGGDVGSHPLEQLGLRDEVGLAVQLHQDPGAGAVERGRDQAVGRRPGGPLGHVLDALEPQQLDRLVELAIRVGQRVLAIHHPCAGSVAKPLHIRAGEVPHVLISHCLI